MVKVDNLVKALWLGGKNIVISIDIANMDVDMMQVKIRVVKLSANPNLRKTSMRKCHFVLLYAFAMSNLRAKKCCCRLFPLIEWMSS